MAMVQRTVDKLQHKLRANTHLEVKRYWTSSSNWPGTIFKAISFRNSSSMSTMWLQFPTLRNLKLGIAYSFLKVSSQLRSRLQNLDWAFEVSSAEAPGTAFRSLITELSWENSHKLMIKLNRTLILSSREGHQGIENIFFCMVSCFGTINQCCLQPCVALCQFWFLNTKKHCHWVYDISGW